MRFATSRLAVAEDSRGEAVDAHLDKPLHAAVLEDVLLRGLGLEDHVKGEGFHLVALGLINL